MCNAQEKAMSVLKKFPRVQQKKWLNRAPSILETIFLWRVGNGPKISQIVCKISLRYKTEEMG